MIKDKMHIRWEPSEKVKSILEEMSLEEKLMLLHGANGDPNCANQAGYLYGIPRLDIPELFLVDGETGVNTSWDATLFPSKVGIGASFDTEVAYEFGKIIGEEVKESGVHMLLAPRLMVARDCIAQFNTSNGGNYQAYGEDPVLIGKLCSAEIRGIQKDNNAIATAKQMVGSSTGTAQGAGNSVIDKRTLNEVYMRPFQDAVEAGVGAIMTSYNQVNGEWSYRHPMLHADLLRNGWNFRGTVMSDWFCLYDSEAIHCGATLEMPGGDVYGEGQKNSLYGLKLLEEIQKEDSPVSEEDINRAAGYYIEMLDRFGMLGTKRKPHAISEKQKAKSAVKARELAAKTGVLLKNDGMLPLDEKKNEKILFVGPTAKNVCCPVFKEGAYGFKDRKIGAVQAMEETTGKKVDFAIGEDLEGELIPAGNLYTYRDSMQHGLKRSAFKIEDKLEKKIYIYQAPKPEIEFDTLDSLLCFEGENALPVLHPEEEQGLYYYMWEGAIEAPEEGWYRISIQTSVPTQEDFEKNIKSNQDMNVGLSATLNFMKDGTDYYERIAAGPRISYNGGAAPVSTVVPCADGFNNIGDYVYMKKGNRYPFYVTATSLYYKKVQVRLKWVRPSMTESNIREVERKSREADKVVVFAWHSSPHYEITFNDNQEEMIKAAYENNRNVAVVVNSGGPVIMPWADRVNAILEMWYPGQEGSLATIDLLMGRANPCGKLPVTFPKNINDMPTHDERYKERYANQGKQPGRYTKQLNVAVFSERLDVGYKWFDRENIEPAYEFGFGLSYTTFAYKKVKAIKEGEGFAVEVTVKNTGKVAGTEVVQCYLAGEKDGQGSVRMPVKQLAAFGKIYLEPGQEGILKMTICKRELSYFHVEKESNRIEEGEGWRLLKGDRMLIIGSSSRDIRLTEMITV